MIHKLLKRPQAIIGLCLIAIVLHIIEGFRVILEVTLVSFSVLNLR